MAVREAADHVAGRTDPADFVRRFDEAWSKSNADALVEILTEDVVLRQPLMPDIVGKAAARAAFGRLFRFFPGLTVTVHGWAARGDVVFIDFTLHGETGGRPISWPAVDRFVLRDGLAAERVSYFDGARVIGEVLRRPRAWRGFLASTLARRR